MNYTELVLQQCEIARRDPQLSDTHKGTFKHAVWAAADCWLPSDVTRGNSRGGGTATPLLPNSHPHPPSLTYHQINENTEGSQEFPHNSSVTLWTTMKDNPCRSSCLWWECVCLCPVRVSVYAQQQDITHCLCQNPNNSHQPGRQAQLDTKTQHRNFNCVTYQVWSSSKRRYVERRGGQGWRKKQQAGQRENEEDKRGACLFAPTALFLPGLEFWQAVPAAWIRQPALLWPGEEGWHTKPGEGGRGEGFWGLPGGRKRAGADWGL